MIDLAIYYLMIGCGFSLAHLDDMLDPSIGAPSHGKFWDTMIILLLAMLWPIFVWQLVRED